MMYLDEPSLAALMGDIRAMIAAALGTAPC